MRFTYSSHRTREAAEIALEDMFASGDVFEAEDPRIERIRGRWCITLPAY